jgi:hypothetical protein
METELAAIFKEARKPSPHAVNALDALVAVEGGELTSEQRQAVRNALTYSISLMTGGMPSKLTVRPQRALGGRQR